MKEDIEDDSDGLSTVLLFRGKGKRFNYKSESENGGSGSKRKRGRPKKQELRKNNGRNNKQRHKGYLAQEIQRIKPELVEEIDDTGMLGIRYDDLRVDMMDAIIELHDRVVALEDKSIENKSS